MQDDFHVPVDGGTEQLFYPTLEEHKNEDDLDKQMMALTMGKELKDKKMKKHKSEVKPKKAKKKKTDEEIEQESIVMSQASNYEAVEDLSLFQAQAIRCCVCGVMMPPNSSNTCMQCLQSTINIAEGLPTKIVLFNCRECGRYKRPPWTFLEAESPQLMSYCLRQIKQPLQNLSLKLLDANFVWTEPHSRRIKIKVTIQKDVMSGTLLQKILILEFVVQNLQCDDCKATYTPHQWNSQVQVRQRVPHKRTFMFLEQLILKHNMTDKTSDIKEADGGLNFNFSNKSQAARLAQFIHENLSSRMKNSKQLISHDEKNGTYHYKYTFSVELAPICKDDLVILPKYLCKELGGIGPMVLVYKISKFIHILDIMTMQTFEIDMATYWKAPFKALLSRERQTEFIVLGVEPMDTNMNNSRAAIKQKFRQAKIEVQRKRDFGKTDETFFVNCHLGEQLNYFDCVMAYDLTTINISDLDEYMHKCKGTQPEVIIVKKSYNLYRKKTRKRRFWKLNHFKKGIETEGEAFDFDLENEDENAAAAKQKKKGKAAKKGPPKQVKMDNRVEANHERDYEMFLQDIEEDPEFRAHIQLYKDSDILEKVARDMGFASLKEVKESDKQKQEEFKQTVQNLLQHFADQDEEDDEEGENVVAPNLGLEELVDLD